MTPTGKILAVIAVILLFLFLSLFNGLFFMMAPSAFEGISKVSESFGYRLSCADLHGGYKCGFGALKYTQPEREGSIPAFECKSDEDCLVTAKGGCTLKGIVPGTANNKVHCVCAKGPVVYGCLPKGDPMLGQERQ